MERIIMRLLIVLGLLLIVAKSCGLHCNDCPTSLASSQCLSCEGGYYLQNNSCLTCPSNCLTCTSYTSCTSCPESYYRLDNICTFCSPTCATCSSYSLCTSCFQNYFLDNSKCLPCTSLCAQCTTSSDCQGCIYGMYLLNSQCVACDVNCMTCKNDIGCSKCYDGYYVQNRGCLPCKGNCSVCSSATACSTCNEQFYLNQSQCISCSLCSNPAYCIRNAMCPLMNPSKSSTSQAASATDPKTVLAIILVPIIGVILLFIGVYKLVSKCAGEEAEAAPVSVETKGTIPTVTDIVSTKVINVGESEQRKESGRPIFIDRNDTL